MSEQWHSVGRIRDAHGIRGEVFVALKAKRADWLDSLEVFRLNPVAGKPWEVSVESVREHKDGLIVGLEGVKDRNQAEALKGTRVEIPEAYITANEDDNSLFLGQYLGLRILDQNMGEIGSVVDLGSNGAQDLLVVENKKGRFEIPLVGAFVVELDLAQGILRMDLPPGLVELE